MDKYHRLAGFIRSKVTSEFLVNEVTAIVKKMTEGKFAMSEAVSFAWTIRDVLEVQGFYVIPDIVEELIACYVARFTRAAAIKFRVNVDLASSLRHMRPILMSTNEIEYAAVPLAIEQIKKVIGVPTEIDHIKARKLLDKRQHLLEESSLI